MQAAPTPRLDDPHRGWSFPSTLGSGLRLLAQAHAYARQLRCAPWELAVEIHDLRACGLTSTDLRWLLGMGYAEHAFEQTMSGDDRRRFTPPGGPVFSEHSCFVLTEAGLTLARKAAEVGGLGLAPSGGNLPPREGAVLPAIPCWDPQRRELRWRDDVVKQFRRPAPNQEAVLAAFEEERWPVRIDDPITPVPEIVPQQRLHDTINHLNRNQKCRLLRFSADGTGRGVRWEPVAPGVT